MGLHIGFMVRWPGKVKAGEKTDAIINIFNDGD